MRALKGPDLFDPRGFLWSLLLDQSMEASEAWLFCVGRLHPLTEVIFFQTD